ncbi:cysteine methyltransferase [Pandoraea terrae]|uniref:Methylated-DNA--protein-cysteine methyltransferase n=1 Tax=Pandoraea terrae TaxID=1537710 RepID=A0A5E4VT84_9BURK|nr:methylated-DNA--[protein]-cysteine S-methyltransferase [Pandoraea terrae]VVE15602.1 cysteine methyltransferase [Pandoraea terrae]
MIFQAHYHSPLGEMLLLADGDALCGVYFDGQKYFPTTSPEWRDGGDLAVIGRTRAALDEFFHEGRRRFDLPLRPQGTPFQKRVWDALRAIPYGSTTTYGAIAAAFGGSNHARAVGTATGRNPISVIVPCHRVLGSDGTLTGYAGGLDRKRALLTVEGVTQGETGALFA